MTPQEAMYQLQSLVDDRKSFLDGDKEHDEVYNHDIEALNTAIKALEKQIPRKPNREFEPYPKHFYEELKSFYCPICGRGLLDQDNDRFIYCADCGQAIDWSEK